MRSISSGFAIHSRPGKGLLLLPRLHVTTHDQRAHDHQCVPDPFDERWHKRATERMLEELGGSTSESTDKTICGLRDQVPRVDRLNLAGTIETQYVCKLCCVRQSCEASDRHDMQAPL